MGPFCMDLNERAYESADQFTVICVVSADVRAIRPRRRCVREGDREVVNRLQCTEGTRTKNAYAFSGAFMRDLICILVNIVYTLSLLAEHLFHLSPHPKKYARWRAPCGVWKGSFPLSPSLSPTSIYNAPTCPTCPMHPQSRPAHPRRHNPLSPSSISCSQALPFHLLSAAAPPCAAD